MTSATTRRLAAARLEIVSDLRARSTMRAVLVAVLVAVAAAAALRWLGEGAVAANRQRQLQQENAALQVSVARLDAELQLERATHAALDAQLAELNQRLADADRQLAFVRAQDDRSRRALARN